MDDNLPSAEDQQTADELMAELFRENDRLRRQLADACQERDMYKKMYNGEVARNAILITKEDMANSIPARPFIGKLIKELEQRGPESH